MLYQRLIYKRWMKNQSQHRGNRLTCFDLGCWGEGMREAWPWALRLVCLCRVVYPLCSYCRSICCVWHLTRTSGLFCTRLSLQHELQLFKGQWFRLFMSQGNGLFFYYCRALSVYLVITCCCAYRPLLALFSEIVSLPQWI